ncbi:hypothetical protein [Micromonospora sp. KC606]|uniref:hypothetical protein n=1 Tax=Micromonospora sp. KC606 TaxID=2530379 RepID=UPI0026900716
MSWPPSADAADTLAQVGRETADEPVPRPRRGPLLPDSLLGFLAGDTDGGCAAVTTSTDSRTAFWLRAPNPDDAASTAVSKRVDPYPYPVYFARRRRKHRRPWLGLSS